MRPWRYLNIRGKILCLCCVLNIYFAILLALEGSYQCIVSYTIALICGLYTYDSKSLKNNEEK